MGYYMGDYGRMMGDPGFFSFIGRALRGGLKLLTGMGGGGGATRVIQAPAAGAIERVGRIAGPIAQRVGRVVRGHPVLTAAGGAAAIGAVGAAVGRAGAPGVERGFHISKTTGALVRNRRMRVTNPRALRRAIRRATGFARLAKRVLRFTSPRAPRGRAVFKFKRKKKI